MSFVFTRRLRMASRISTYAAVCLLLASAVEAQLPPRTLPPSAAQAPGSRQDGRFSAPTQGPRSDANVRPVQNQEPAAQEEHPLRAALKLAYEAAELMDRDIKDYSATLVKRERIDGKLTGPEYIFVKIRHEPFSVYTHYLAPADMKGQEAIYVHGKNDNKLVAHGTGLQSVIGTVTLDPQGGLAMKGQRYPITVAGLRNMLRKVIEIGEYETGFGECEVKFFKGAKVDGRSSLMIEIAHPVKRKNFKFALTRIFVDEEWKLPVRIEAYDWGPKPGDPPLLVEEYTYLKLQFNRGYTDLDFDPQNKSYGFR